MRKIAGNECTKYWQYSVWAKIFPFSLSKEVEILWLKLKNMYKLGEIVGNWNKIFFLRVTYIGRVVAI